MDDEPLSRWAERRDARVGQLRAVPLVTGDGPRASHLNPDAPRAIQRWNGHLWEPHGFAENLAEARRVLFPETEAAALTPRRHHGSAPGRADIGGPRRPHEPCRSPAPCDPR
ncbi:MULTISPECIES: DUF6087 family protein [Streptomyces]|uniref:DUF6087 family protein n=1 Tax=Streptomyces TaxID=1883 RepID=UPI001EEFF446|nr:MULTISPECIES: DUF6087 family protein [unclassified Streptomyces]MCI4143880.1 DUF6087 family protein [Streptomyces sp. MMS20-AI2-20]